MSLGGVVQPNPGLDLPVNSNSERGLLSWFCTRISRPTPSVYVRWTESSSRGRQHGRQRRCPCSAIGLIVTSGTAPANVYPTISTYPLRARQTDNIPSPVTRAPNNPNETANHNGGVMRFVRTGSCTCSWVTRGGEAGCRTFAEWPFFDRAVD